MKTRKFLWSSVLASSLFVSLPGFTAEESSRGGGVATKPESPTFDISFPGGTLTQFVAHVNKAIEAHVRNPSMPNLIFPPEAASLKVPKLELRAVDVQTLMSAVRLLLPSSEYIWQPSGPSTYVLVARPDSRDTRVFFVGHLLTKFKIEDITTALETAWQMSSKTKTDLKYHQDTKLLMVRADHAQLEVASAVLNQLRDAWVLQDDESTARQRNAAKPEPKR